MQEVVNGLDYLEMNNMKDFLIWLAIGGALKMYFKDLNELCERKGLLVSDQIRKMDEDKPELFLRFHTKHGDLDDVDYLRRVEKLWLNYLEEKDEIN